jgi:hypothetical protein
VCAWHRKSRFTRLAALQDASRGLPDLRRFKMWNAGKPEFRFVTGW